MAEERDPRQILTAPERKTADLLVAWLTEKGYPAAVVVQPMTTVSDPLTGATSAVAGEFQVWVTKTEHAQPAAELLAEQRAGVEALKEREARRASQAGPVTAACEDCGKSSDWPGAEIGTTQTCPHCHRYMDIPDPEDTDWEGFDFGSEDEGGSEGEGDNAGEPEQGV